MYNRGQNWILNQRVSRDEDIKQKQNPMHRKQTIGKERLYPLL